MSPGPSPGTATAETHRRRPGNGVQASAASAIGIFTHKAVVLEKKTSSDVKGAALVQDVGVPGLR